MTARRMSLTLTLLALCGSAAADDEGKPIRAVTYGTFVSGVLTGADQDASGSRSDIYRFHGRIGEGVHVAALTRAPEIIVEIVDGKTGRTLEADPSIADDEAAGWGSRSAPQDGMAVDITLPRDGDYDVVIRSARQDMTEDSPPIEYTLGVDRERVAGWLQAAMVKPDLGLGFHFSGGIGFALLGLSDGTHAGEDTHVEFGPGYQVSETFGLDLILDAHMTLASVQGMLTGAFAFQLGPRARYGNKHHGFWALSLGPSLLTIPTALPTSVMAPEAQGFGVCGEWDAAPGRAKNPRSKVTLRLFAQMQWHGDASLFTTGFGTSL